jgi:hypothetical protein
VPSINYGASAYLRTNGNLPPLTLINMFLEQAKTSENQVCLLSRPGLVEFSEVGDGPISGIFCEAGTLSGDLFSISDSTLYRDTTSKGTISGSGPVKWAGSENELLVTRGGTLYSYNGTGSATSAGFTGSFSNNVTSVCFIGDLFVAVEADSARIFWSAPLDGRTWDVLDFATAERKGDLLLDVAALNDNLWLFGQETIEAWAHTGDADLPFTQIEQVGFDKGILDTGCVVNADNTLFFIGSNSTVYRLGEVPQRISDHSIEGRILASATASVFSFQHEGHEFVCVRLEDETLAYDCATGEWCEFQTSQGNWIVTCAAQSGQTVYFGHEATGQILQFYGWDELGEELERRFSAAAPLDAPTSIARVTLWANTGSTEVLNGQGSDPIIEMRTSDDAGMTWGEWDADSLGAAGEYRMIPEWRALGMFDFPGFLAEFRVTDPVPLRISAVKVNDPAGGRSRG